MEKSSLSLLVVPLLWLAVMWTASKAVRQQPRLTSAGSATRFGQVVERSGGRTTTERGLVLDGIFILLVLAFVPLAFAGAGDGLWWVTAVAAGVIDAVEDLLLWRLVRTSTTGRTPYQVLSKISLLKYGAYLSVIVGLVVTLCC